MDHQRRRVMKGALAVTAAAAAGMPMIGRAATTESNVRFQVSRGGDPNGRHGAQSGSVREETRSTRVGWLGS